MKIKVILIVLIFSNSLNFLSKALYYEELDPNVFASPLSKSPKEDVLEFESKLPRPMSAVPWDNSHFPEFGLSSFDDGYLGDRPDPRFFPCFNYRKSRAMIYKVEEKKDSIKIYTHYSKIPIKLNRKNEDDGVLVDIIKSKAFQRLKNISHYGPSNFIPNARNILYGFNQFGNYTRYEHCLGVLAILILKCPDCSLYEKLAALLHDVAHTAFSHLADFLFEVVLHDTFEYLSCFFSDYGLEDILSSYNIQLDSIFIRDEENYKACLPPIVKQGNCLLCADNIEYHLNGCYKAGILTVEEVKEIFQNLHYDVNKRMWYLSDIDLAILFKVAVDHLIQNNCLSLWNKRLFEYVAQKIKKAIDDFVITEDDIMYNLHDNDIWFKVFNEDMIKYANSLVPCRSTADFPILAKSDGESVKDRRINPYVRLQYKLGRYKFRRLRNICPELYL